VLKERERLSLLLLLCNSQATKKGAFFAVHLMSITAITMANEEDEEVDDDFADFEQAATAEKAPSVTEVIDEDDFDDFADFETADVVEVPVTEAPATQEAPIEVISVNTEPFSARAERLIKSAFVDEKEEDDGDEDMPIELFAEKFSSSVWNSLQGQEEGQMPPSLKLKWPSSHSFQVFLSALQIDPRNIELKPLDDF